MASKKTSLLLFVLTTISIVLSYGQQKIDYNLGFENIPLQNGMPSKWMRWTKHNDFVITIDSKIKFEGNASLRIASDKKSTNYECLLQKIPINKLGDTITVKANVKFQNVSNFVGLILRLDAGKEQMVEYYDMMEEKINGTKDWTEFSISLPLSDKIQTVFIGAILSGKGKLWVDNFSLLIDGKDFIEAPEKEIKIFKAKADTVEFKESSKIIINSLNSQQINNLDKLGRIWGMMKYFHPAVIRGDYNWDYELFRILPEILNVREDRCNFVLANWMFQFGGFYEKKRKQTIRQPLKMEADFRWAKNNKLFSYSLIKVLNYLRNEDRIEEHYYVDFNHAAGNVLFKNEDAYENMKFPDAGYRLLSLFRYWNMVQYFFPYRYLIEDNWDLVLKEFIPKFIFVNTELEYQLVVLELITRINDTHAQIYNEHELVLNASKGLYIFPYNIQFVDNKPVIVKPINEKLAKKSKLQQGDIILKMNDQNVYEIILELAKYTSASNEAVCLRNIANSLMRSVNGSMVIEYQRDNIVGIDTVSCPNMYYIYNNMTNKKPSYQRLTSKIGYVYIEALKRDSIDFVMKKFKNTEGIIIDLRCYPYESTLYELGTHLVPKPTAFAKGTRTYLSDIGSFYFKDTLTIGKENKDYYKGKVAILVNEQTQSSAEFHAMGFQVAPNAVVIGSTTAAADGNVSYIWLPGGIQTLISGIGVYYPDGTETQRIGIVPDIEVKPTIKGIKEGRDEVLEKAIEWIKEK